MTESWLPVREFPDYYEISSFGRLRGIRAYRNSHVGKIRKPQTAKSGYIVYMLSIDSVPYLRSAHRMVADAFLGPIPDGMQVNHKDGNKSNPHVDNLEIVTNSQNREHSYKILGIQANGRIITNDDARIIRYLYETGLHSQRTLAKRYGVSQQLIARYVKIDTPHSKATKGEDNGSAKLTVKQVRRIRDLYANGGIYQHQLAAKFGVSQNTISAIIRRKLWSDVD